MTSEGPPRFTNLQIEHQSGSAVFHVILNRPTARNALDKAFWKEISQCFHYLGQLPSCRCIILSAVGPIFCAGIDLLYAMKAISSITADRDPGRVALKLNQFIKEHQNTFTAIESCRVPVIAAIDGGCIGAGIDMVTACDIRICTSNAWFTVKEIDIGIAADVGTLQRLPKVVGNQSWVRDVCLTGRRFDASEAMFVGLVSRVEESYKDLIKTSYEFANCIAAKSPIAVCGIKLSLNFSRDHSVQESLDQIALWNSSMLQSDDLSMAGEQVIQQRKGEKQDPPIFSHL